jgi:DNA-binding transcriptional regulator GbsR (MarR family)
VQQVWVKGDRKDYYRATDWFGKIIRNVFLDTVGKNIEAHANFMAETDGLLAAAKNGGNGDIDEAFLKERLEHLRAFHKRVQGLWNSPVLKMFLK